MPVDMSVANRIATVVINRPEKLNALDFETIRLLQEALSECEAESGVGAIVLTGAGDNAGAGADVPTWQPVFGAGQHAPCERSSVGGRD